MAIIASDSGGGTDFAPLPQGTHIAICNMVVDLGLQNGDFQGTKSVKRQIYIRWEIPKERMTGERAGPMTIGRTYTLSLHEKAGLRRDLVAWRGKQFTADELAAFDVSKLLGHPVMLTVTHNVKPDGGISARVAGLAAFPKGVPKPGQAENALVLYDDDTQDDYDRLPDWIKKKLDERVIPAVADTKSAQFDRDLDDDVPF